MRCYSFTHFMLSSMAQGIQPAHATVEMFTKYTYDIENHIQGNMLYEWASLHKTMILLNGGTTPQMNELYEFMNNPENPYPWSHFNEDESLNYLMTSISIVLPEKIYEASSLLKNGKFAIDTDKNYISRSILSEDIIYSYYDQETLDKINDWQFTEWEVELIRRLMKYRLAN